MTTLKRGSYEADRTMVQPLRFFCRGDGYRFWGQWPGDFHLVCPPRAAPSSSGTTGSAVTCSRGFSTGPGSR
ncbi:MAG: hypothetical protein R3C69_13820 [Geminicoccaceae bacterium]